MKNNTLITLEQYKKIKTKEMIENLMSGGLIDGGLDHFVLEIFYNFGTRLFVDVGVNQGNWINYIKENFNDMEILGFEADTRIYNRCLKNYDFIENIGILNKNGFAKFYFNYDSTQTSNKFHHDKSYMVIRVKKLDKYYNYIKNYKFPFIKIDVEGSEPEVIYSAKKIIKNLNNLILFFEYSYKWKYNEKETYKLFNFLRQNGFVLFRLNAFGLELVPPMTYHYLSNYHFSNILALNGFKFKDEDMVDIDSKYGKLKMYVLLNELNIRYGKE